MTGIKVGGCGIRDQLWIAVDVGVRLMRGALLLGALALLGCTGRGNITPDPEAPGIGREIPVLVGTTRARTPDGLWSPNERGVLNYARIDVSIPPTHRAGIVELPDDTPDATTDFVARRVEPLASASLFQDQVEQLLAARPDASGEVVVLVHGFNNAMGDSVFRAAQIVHDLRLSSIPVLYSWPSRGAPLAYAADRDAVMFARDGLERMLDDVCEAGAGNVLLVAHSMGSLLTMEVLRQMALRDNRGTLNCIGGVVLMSPDIDVEVFRSQAEAIGDLPEPFVIFTSQKDPALGLSARISGQPDRLGNLNTVAEIAGLDVTVVDLTEIDDAASQHEVAVTSPTILGFLDDQTSLRESLLNERGGRVGVLPGTVLVAQEATTVLLSPIAAATGSPDW